MFPDNNETKSTKQLKVCWSLCRLCKCTIIPEFLYGLKFQFISVMFYFERKEDFPPRKEYGPNY